MIEVSCQTCGEMVGVKSLLAAAQQPCRKCGHLLMGTLSRGTRTAPPAGFAEPLPYSEPLEPGRGNAKGWLLGAFAGALVGVAAVAAVGLTGPGLSPSGRGVLLGALSGVLLAPIFALTSFFSMLILPFSLEGILGDSLWNRLAKAHLERRIGPLIIPLLVYVGLPMTLCAMGGAKVKNPAGLVIPAGLGAVALGAILGAMGGSLVGKARRE